MIYKDIENFSKQFSWKPKIENGKFLKQKRFKSIIVVGMGGSALAARLFSFWKSDYPLIIHNDYGLPKLSNKNFQNSLIILSSYSGNTEEVIDSFKESKKNKLAMAIITAGGKLLSLAKKNKIPYIELPDKEIQPRMAIGYSFLALTKLIKEEKIFKETIKLTNLLRPLDFQVAGKKLAQKIGNCIPIIYSSFKNAPLGYIWKIKFNETAKMPAFANVFPELNHNELAGFDSSFGKEKLNEFYFIFLTDINDSFKIKKRMKITKIILQNNGAKVEKIKLKGETISHKIFSSLILVDWTTFYLAQKKKIDPEKVLIIEKFKKLMKK